MLLFITVVRTENYTRHSVGGVFVVAKSRRRRRRCPCRRGRARELARSLFTVIKTNMHSVIAAAAAAAAKRRRLIIIFIIIIIAITAVIVIIDIRFRINGH